MKGVDADYAYYQKAICYGFVAKTIKKLKSWIPLYNCIQNPITDDAMYELANTYVASGKQDLALKTFDRLISEFKTDLILQNQFCVKDWFITTLIEMRML
jgi:outer membrane protein assembly factor BamD (BamD/ComL family)